MIKDYDAFEHFCETAFPNNPRGIVVLVTMYLDAASKLKPGTNDPLFHTLTGFSATVDNWRKFRKEWDRDLTAKGVDHFHMTKFEYAKNKLLHGHEIKQRKNPFAHLPLTDFDPLFNRMAATIGRKSNGVRRLHSYGSTVVSDDFYNSRPAELEDDLRCTSPYVFNAYALIRAMAIWAKRTKLKGDIAYVFATGDKEIGQLHDLFLYIKKRPKIQRDLRVHWANNEVLKQVEMKSESAIQAADILAYETQAMVDSWVKSGKPDYIPPNSRRKELDLLTKYSEFDGWIYAEDRIKQEFAIIKKIGKWVQ